MSETSKKPARVGKKAADPASAEPVRLSGGNPQIPKGYGDAPVQAYIAAMPAWKSEVGRRRRGDRARRPRRAQGGQMELALLRRRGARLVSRLYVFARYIKVAFFCGASLNPVPPVGSRQKDVRYLHIHEDDPLDELQFADWVEQASRLPGERM